MERSVRYNILLTATVMMKLILINFITPFFHNKIIDNLTDVLQETKPDPKIND